MACGYEVAAPSDEARPTLETDLSMGSVSWLEQEPPVGIAAVELYGGLLTFEGTYCATGKQSYEFVGINPNTGDRFEIHAFADRETSVTLEVSGVPYRGGRASVEDLGSGHAVGVAELESRTIAYFELECWATVVPWF
jgi:hypothetical protein